MILVDTSVWVHHFRKGNARLAALLEATEAVTHPMILGELACGGLPDRARTLHLLRALPLVEPAPDSIVLNTIETHRWRNTGFGWIDAHLLTAALTQSIPILTLDRGLARAASALGLTA